MIGLKIILIFFLVLWVIGRMTDGKNDLKSNIDKIINIIQIVVGCVLPIIILKM